MNTESRVTTALAEMLNVSKWFGPVMALNGVSLEIGSGITGLVGPNGAGKTTLLRLLTGQIKPSLGGSTCAAGTPGRPRRKITSGCAHSVTRRGMSCRGGS